MTQSRRTHDDANRYGMIQHFAGTAILYILLVGGCSAGNPPKHNIGTASTPDTWLDFSELYFAVTDQTGESIGGIHLLTFDDPVKTCGPDMLRAEISSDSTGLIPDWGYNVGYFVDGNQLVVEFGIPVCDATYEISAMLSEDGGEGDFRSVSPWGGKSLGSVRVSDGPH